MRSIKPREENLHGVIMVLFSYLAVAVRPPYLSFGYFLASLFLCGHDEIILWRAECRTIDNVPTNENQFNIPLNRT